MIKDFPQIGGLHMTSRRPCWWNFNKRILLTDIVSGTNRATISLYIESQGIDCKTINTPVSEHWLVISFNNTG